MFKILCKTPEFSKKKWHRKLNQLYYRMFCVIPKLAPPLSAIFQTGAPFERKEGHSFEGGVHQIFHVKRGGGGALI